MSAMGFLLIAIACELIATTSLKLSEGFTRLVPSVVVVAGYATAFYMMSQALRLAMPVGTAYAIWSGLGTVGIAIIGIALFNEPLNLTRIVGIALIVAGVLVLNLLSPSTHA
jgi:multidrug transporter EmrE-like cation transporter